MVLSSGLKWQCWKVNVWMRAAEMIVVPNGEKRRWLVPERNKVGNGFYMKGIDSCLLRLLS